MPKAAKGTNQPSTAKRDWLFDPASGYMLDFSAQGAVCPHTNTRYNLAQFTDVKIVHRSDMKGFYRRYGLEPLVKDTTMRQEVDVSNKKAGATTDERCPQCNKKGLSFFTLQLRSADEGQTVFYECNDCGYKYSQNN